MRIGTPCFFRKENFKKVILHMFELVSTLRAGQFGFIFCRIY